MPVRLAATMSGGAGVVLLQVLLVLVGAKVGGELAERIRQPAVLGELVVGILLGASLFGGFVGMPDFELAREAERLQESADGEGGLLALGSFFHERSAELLSLEVLSFLATLGVILLLFEVGLESDVKELARVGASSLVVALVGIAASFVLGYAFSWALARAWAPWQAAGDALPPYLLHVFVGATLTATSVGITARVLADMGQLQSREARIILGAAVLDDIGGLIILAIVAALVDAAAGGATVSATGILWITAKAIGFLAVALAVGLKAVPRAFDALVARFRIKGFPVALAISFALLMAYLASLFGLADIVGAFAGGLILAQAKAAHRIFEDLRPLAAVFVGFFFVTLGMRVDLTRMEGHAAAVLGIGIVLTLIAVLAKLTCGWGVLRRDDASRLVVGVGMAPRGEVGLIFAALGLEAGLIANWQYTAVILVVLATTFVTPIWLKRLHGGFRARLDTTGTEHAQAMSEVLEP